jgi:hypothetical protein
MQRTRRRKPIATGVSDRLQRQRADEAAARARVAADAACLNSAPALERASAEQPTVNEVERDAAFRYLRH